MIIRTRMLLLVTNEERDSRYDPSKVKHLDEKNEYCPRRIKLAMHILYITLRICTNFRCQCAIAAYYPYAIQ